MSISCDEWSLTCSSPDNSRQMAVLLVLLLSMVGGLDAVSLRPSAFLKLPDKIGSLRFGVGSASHAAFDEERSILYVVGTYGGVLNVVDMADPDNPVLAQTIGFDAVIDGYPDSIAYCKRNYIEHLAISFVRTNTPSPASVRFFKPLTSPTDEVVRLYSVPVNGFDPTDLAWSNDCSRLVVVSQGRVHRLNGVFDDPTGDVEVIQPRPGNTADRILIPITSEKLAAAGARQVFSRCSSGSELVSDRRQDYEPRSVTIDANNVAYIASSKNNVLGGLNLEAAQYELQFAPQLLKSWRNQGIDTSSQDGGINLQSYPINTFYQSAALASFTMNGETFLASADTGEFTRYSIADVGCDFEESATGYDWLYTINNAFAGSMSSSDQSILREALGNPAKLAQMRFTNLKTAADGYSLTQEGYSHLTGYGGRGMSVLRVSTQTRVYDSGDLFERVFTEASTPSVYRELFNARLEGGNSKPTDSVDQMSPETGPRPSAIAVGRVDDDTLLLVVSNGNVGGLYTSRWTRGTRCPTQCSKASSGEATRGSAGTRPTGATTTRLEKRTYKL
ncbi:uncharacterized protein LOC112554252 isoform X3 [Pomacea canaliculata]|uniref:uncharacterized protein LOC112554252 isoform X3 n=1 Tax=Pomacea canaliculata TaxID=400727 RepID=UPI000D73F3BB|nr:uncharacterized protein LOC112554252 isoform X3 [Pomacea canaliculata]